MTDPLVILILGWYVMVAILIRAWLREREV